MFPLILDRVKSVADPVSGDLPTELIAAIAQVYAPAGMALTDDARREVESAEYSACRFGLDNQTIVFRVAKTTPTKMGQFVTLWKRLTSVSEIAPLDISDGVDFVVVSVADASHCGQFVFDRKTLAAKGVMSVDGEGGKRAIRVYPPWVTPIARQAIRTQQWQLKYFLALDQSGDADFVQVRRLFENKH
ncbi:MepB family protein [Pseudomonas sp. dw_612]|uniref:MepB family protein n=1 Tax=Pseudomonas sp. dw_612 TaxID=2720080 RepID=UPI002116788C|nr:MepB family protein [Pseudomonas sp. dw_612]